MSAPIPTSKLAGSVAGQSLGVARGSANYGHNPTHAIGTCGNCGAEMVYNVPRLGPSGGFVHKATGSLVCENSANQLLDGRKERTP